MNGTLGHQAAAAFHAAAAIILRDAGARATQSEVARIVKTAQGNYSASINGNRDVGMNRVARWIKAWNASGLAPLRMVFDGTDITVLHAGASDAPGGP